MTTETMVIRPLRSDAARNLRLINAAAIEVISERGTEASMEQIAQRAGVGVGTLYRRFPNKDALLMALVDDMLVDLVASARALLGTPDGMGLEKFMHQLGRSFVLHRGWMTQLLGRAAPSSCADELRRVISQLIDEAKAHGRLAPHVTLTDIQMMMWALRGVVDVTAAVAPKAWIRHLELHLAGLRLNPSPTSRPPMTRAQLAATTVRTV
jgi:AcrR family transcriptional regulator